MVAVMVPVWLAGAAPCTTAMIRLINAPVPMPTAPITIIGTQSGSPAGSMAITKRPAAPSDVPMMGKIR